MTNTDICNMALSHIARGSILSLNDDIEEARQCRLHYDHLRKLLLRDYSWGFAKRVATLARLAVDMPGWWYAYAYPEKCIAARLIFNAAGARVKEFEKEKYEVLLVQDNVMALCCDVDDALMEYTYDAVDVDNFPPDFCEALSRLLASTLAVPLTSNGGLQEVQYQLYQVAVQGARLATANERQKLPEYPNSYVEARRVL